VRNLCVYSSNLLIGYALKCTKLRAICPFQSRPTFDRKIERSSAYWRFPTLKMNSTVAVLLCFLGMCVLVNGWNDWNYTVQWSEDETKVEDNKLQWHGIWDLPNYRGNSAPPRPRRGHSLHLVKTDPNSDFKGATYVVLFGGRDNDQKAVHVPRTYNVKSVSPQSARLNDDTSILIPTHFCYSLPYRKTERSSSRHTTRSL
jgi:hypothetical protein